MTLQTPLDHIAAGRPVPLDDPAPHPCPYLPSRQARLPGMLYGDWSRLSPLEYDRLLSQNHRRAGVIVYRPACPSCRACQSIRVPVATFKRSRSQRRVWRNNQDVRVQIARPVPSEESYAVYRRYQAFQHDGTMPGDFRSFVAFLYRSVTDTIELTYRVGDQLMAVSIVDRVPTGFSSVYVFFDPRFAARSPGTFTALWEIEHCRRIGLAYYYLGYYVERSPKMAYKARFRPNELLDASGQWRPFCG